MLVSWNCPLTLALISIHRDQIYNVDYIIIIVLAAASSGKSFGSRTHTERTTVIRCGLCVCGAGHVN